MKGPIKLSELNVLQSASEKTYLLAIENGEAKSILANAVGGNVPVVTRYYYTSLSAAVADLNAETTENADATAETAACSLYTDSDNEQVLELLADIELVESLTITVNSRFNLNGHLISYNGDYSLNFNGEQCVLDGSVAGSKLYKQSVNNTASSQLVFMESGKIVGVNFELIVTELGGSHDCITIQNGNVLVEDCIFAIDCKYTGSSLRYEVYTVNAKDNSNLTVARSTVNMNTDGKIVNGAIRSNQNAGDAEVIDSSIIINGANCGEYGPYGIYLSGKNADICSVKNTSVVANRADGGGFPVFVTGCKTAIVDNVKVTGNFPAVKGIGMKFSHTDAYITDCFVISSNETISTGAGCNGYISNCTIYGYAHSLYCANGVDYTTFVNDSNIKCKFTDGLTNCGSIKEPTSCCYIGEGSATGNTVYIDGCTMESVNKNDSGDYAVTVRSNAATPTTVNLSNCVIDTGLAKPIRIEDGGNDNQLAAVNIGFNTVDANGNPITKDYAVDEDVDGVADANADFLYVTGLLYRRLPDNVQATGRDYEAMYKYLTSIQA